MPRVTIDPITRIEGHLRIEVEITGDRVTSAWSTGTLFRGIEIILQGRQPEDAWLFTQRLCGVCTYVHGSTSVRCVENALDLQIPESASIVRNLMMGAQFLHDHLVHFYHLHALDWVDIVGALAADPQRTANLAREISPEAGTIDFAAIKTRLGNLVNSGKLGPFAGGFWGHPAYRLSPEENLLLTAHYLVALRQQASTARMHAIFGGKNPHPQSLRVGGVTCNYELTASRCAEFRTLLEETKRFIDTVYIPDVALVAEKYGDWSAIGATSHFLAYGEFPQSHQEPGSLYFPQGVIFDRGKVLPLDQALINEHVSHSWYEGTTALHPSIGETLPRYTNHDTADRYSWLKAPRYQEESMEVGPLARMLVAYGAGRPHAVSAVDDFLARVGMTPEAMYSTLGRVAARALETQIIANAMKTWLSQLEDRIKYGKTTLFKSWRMPSQASGVGFNEAPRGALGHWIDIQNGKIANYQMVVPSTWNFGPRCANEKPGPVELALVGTPIADPQRPLEVLRTVHSFDPCIACAVHVIDRKIGKTYDFKVL